MVVDFQHQSNKLLSLSLIEKSIRQKKIYVNPIHLQPYNTYTDDQLNTKQEILVKDCKSILSRVTYFKNLGYQTESHKLSTYNLMHGPPGVGKRFHQFIHQNCYCRCSEWFGRWLLSIHGQSSYKYTT
jgi:hypothetical protein